MIIRGMLALLLVAFGVTVARGAAAENEIDCADLSLRFDTAGNTTFFCYAGTSKGRNAGEGAIGWSGDWEMMYAYALGVRRAASVFIGNRHTYTDVVGVKERVEESRWFDLISGWSEPYKFDGYEVVRFDARWSDITYDWHCAGFTRYARPSYAGYREALKGYFCVVPGQEVEEEALRSFLASISY